MSLMATSVVILLSISMVWANAPCRQRSARDFRADNSNCSVFYVCSMGQLVQFTCRTGSVFDERSQSCVPVNSYNDRCSKRLAARHRCPPGARGPIPHSTHCAQYYDCGTAAAQMHQQQSVRGWEPERRECPYPLVFSVSLRKCVTSAPGVCGRRQEPLDQCDYKVNQCEGHADCVPCHVRFPSCRALPDGLNAWSGRKGSPYYITCHQQRVLSTGMCSQEGGVTIFDEEGRRCVTTKPTPVEVTQPVRQTTQRTPQFLRPLVPGWGNGNAPQQSSGYLGNTQHATLPPFQVFSPNRNQNQHSFNHHRHPVNQYQTIFNPNRYNPYQN